MPSPIAHTVTGYVVSQLFLLHGRTRQRNKNWGIILYAIFVANAADLDFIPQLLTGERFHHGLTHSITLCALAGMLSALVAYYLKRDSWKKIAIVTLLLYTSHLIMDMVTAGGNGIQFLWPFSKAFFISPILIFPETHHSTKLLHHPGHIIFICFELGYSTLLFGVLWMWRKTKKTVSFNL